MAEMVIEQIIELPDPPDISHLQIDGGFVIEAQKRLLVETFYSSWKPERRFLATTNVSIYRGLHSTVIAPDMFLSLDVVPAQDWWEKEHRCYFLWEFGKPPEVVIEIVSNKKGRELSKKMREYALMGVWYYVVFDPENHIQDESLVVYELIRGRYVRKLDTLLDDVELSLQLWQGEFEGKPDSWLRWADLDGNLIPTGHERAESEYQRAELERQRAEILAAKLRELGIDPDTLT